CPVVTSKNRITLSSPTITARPSGANAAASLRPPGSWDTQVWASRPLATSQRTILAPGPYPSSSLPLGEKSNLPKVAVERTCRFCPVVTSQRLTPPFPLAERATSLPSGDSAAENPDVLSRGKRGSSLPPGNSHRRIPSPPQLSRLPSGVQAIEEIRSACRKR